MIALSYESTLQNVVKLVSRHAPDLPVTEMSRFGADLALGSVEVMDLVADIEDAYEVNIPLNLLPSLVTVGDTARALHDLRRARAPRLPARGRIEGPAGRLGAEEWRRTASVTAEGGPPAASREGLAERGSASGTGDPHPPERSAPAFGDGA